MKRLLSWIVMTVLEYLMLIAVSFVVSLIIRAFHSIGQLSEGLFWAVVILGGGTVLGVVGSLVFLGNGLVVAASEGICNSRRGTRYIVLSTLIFGMYGFLIYAITKRQLFQQ